MAHGDLWVFDAVHMWLCVSYMGELSAIGRKYLPSQRLMMRDSCSAPLQQWGECTEKVQVCLTLRKRTYKIRCWEVLNGICTRGSCTIFEKVLKWFLLSLFSPYLNVSIILRHTLPFTFLHDVFYFTMLKEYRASFLLALSLLLSLLCEGSIPLTRYFKTTAMVFWIIPWLNACSYPPHVFLNIWYFSKTGRQH